MSFPLAFYFILKNFILISICLDFAGNVNQLESGYRKFQIFVFILLPPPPFQNFLLRFPEQKQLEHFRRSAIEDFDVILQDVDRGLETDLDPDCATSYLPECLGFI